MILFLWFILVCQLVFIFICEYKTRSLFLFVWPIVFIFLGLPIGLEILGLIPRHPPSTLFNGLIYAIIFNFFYFSAYIIVLFILKKTYPYTVEKELFNSRSQLLCFSLLSSFIIICILFVNGITPSSIFYSDWREKSKLGIFSVVIIWVLSLMAGCFFYSLDKKQFDVALIIFVTFLIVLVFYRTRGVIANFFIAGAIYWVLCKRGSIVIVILGGILAIFLSFLVRTIRFMGDLANITEVNKVKDLFSQQLIDLFSKGDLSIYNIYLNVVEECGKGLNCFNYTYLDSVGNLLGLSGDKEIRIEYYLFNNLVESGIGGSLHPTVYGVIYSDMSIFGGAIFISLIGALHATICSIFKGGKEILLLGFIGSYTVFFARGSIYNSLSSLLIGGVMTLLVCYILQIKVKKTR